MDEVGSVTAPSGRSRGVKDSSELGLLYPEARTFRLPFDEHLPPCHFTAISDTMARKTWHVTPAV